MLRHIIIAAFRNMAASKLLSSISILGLAIGIAIALLMGLVVRNQMTFDHFIPTHARTYRAVLQFGLTKPCSQIGCSVGDSVSERMRLDIPQIESLTRLVHSGDIPVKLAQGNVSAWEEIYWADANVFDIFPMAVLHGDLKTALARPDGIVLPRVMAEKYFGRADAVGGTITLEGHPMVVRAVIDDLPANGTSLRSGIFASGRTPSSRLLAPGTKPGSSKNPNTFLSAQVYLRLRPGVPPAAVEKPASDISWGDFSPADQAILRKGGEGHDFDISLLPLDRLNLHEAFNPGIGLRLPAAIAAGLLVLFIAAVNFVNLMVARAARREREVGVRKACGADRATLMVQFLGEAMIAVALAGCIALALSEWLMPALNAFLDTGAQLNYGGDALLLPALLTAVVVLGLAAGAYPALVLSSFKPAGILRGRSGGAGVVRNVLVTLQFTILIVLAIAAGVIWRQHDYATQQALRVDIDQMLVMRITRPAPVRMSNMGEPGACPGFREAVSRLQGVVGAFCGGGFVEDGLVFGWEEKGGKPLDPLGMHMVDARLLSLYGVKPVAGALPPIAGPSATDAGAILNVTAVRRLGFASAQAAIGKSWLTPEIPAETRDFATKIFGNHTSITAVVPDFSFRSLAAPDFVGRLGAIYSPWVGMGRSNGALLHVKLDGRRIPETLAAIDRLWESTNQYGRLDRVFVSEHMEQLYRGMRREAQFLAGCAGITIFLACLGLIGIAVAGADRRTKEIGVRKAMGARTWQVTALLLWQFSLPVLLGSLMAWPIAFWLMQRWLSGFAWRIDLEWWMFVAASGAALLLALLTVAGQAIQTARAKPVLALRYE